MSVDLSVFSSYLGTSTMTIMSPQIIRNTIGTTTWNTVQYISGGAMWLIYISFTWYQVTHFL